LQIKINRDKGCQVNNLVTFSGKPIGSGEFLVQMVEVLGVNISINILKEDFVKGKIKP